MGLPQRIRPAQSHSGEDKRLMMNDEAAPSPKQADILNAAHALFMEQGYGATSMDAIAASAGVSKRTIYSHFESKDGLFSAMMDVACARIGGADFAEGEDPEPTTCPRAFLERYGLGFVSIINSPEGLSVFRIVIHEAARFPDLVAAFYRSGPARIERDLVAYLEAFAAAGAMRVDDPTYAAWLFVSMLKGRPHFERLLAMAEEPTPAEAAAFVARVVDDFLKIYGAPTTVEG